MSLQLRKVKQEIADLPSPLPSEGLFFQRQRLGRWRQRLSRWRNGKATHVHATCTATLRGWIDQIGGRCVAACGGLSTQGASMKSTQGLHL